MNANEGTTTNSGGGGSWIWQMEFFTLLNLGFDVGCLGLCIHLLTSSYLAHRRRRRPQSNRRHPLPSLISTSGATASRTRGNSVNGVTHASAANGTTSGGAVGNAPPPTFSVWAHKRQWIVLTSVLATGLWHLNRLLLIVVLSLDTIRRGDNTSNSNGNSNSSGDGFEWEEEERKRSENPLRRAPAVYIVVFLPAVLVLSRLLLVASFAFPTGMNPSPSSSSAVSSSSNNDEKLIKSPTTTTTKTLPSPSSPPLSRRSSSSSLLALDTLTSRMYGSRRNVYMLAFYACVGGMLALVPFTYNPVWYFDTPRIELMTSLYLAGVLQDAERVKRGLSAKEK
ncbi:hypothetical protein FRC17_010790, partial [Serendipita sp. 399]